MTKNKLEIAIGEHLVTEAIKNSDDFERNKEIFIKAASVLVNNGALTLEDFKDFGGWVRSVTSSYCYFVYRKDRITLEDRFYVNTMTNQLWNSQQQEPYQL